MKDWTGTWKSNNGNTWSNHVYSAHTRIGLLRLLAKIIDGNLTGPHDNGTATLWAPGNSSPERPDDVAVRIWYDNKWHRGATL
jgi:hypothetical protein